MKNWLSKRRNCIILALVLNTVGLILAALIVPHLWFWRVQNEALVFIMWALMYPLITFGIYKYLRWQGRKEV